MVMVVIMPFMRMVMVFMGVMVIMLLMTMIMSAAALFPMFMVVMIVSVMVVMLMRIVHIQLSMMHGVQNLLSIQIVPRRCNHRSCLVMLTKQGNRFLKLLLCHALGAA